MLYVFNKADKLANKEDVALATARFQPHVVISSTSKETMEPLIGVSPRLESSFIIIKISPFLKKTFLYCFLKKILCMIVLVFYT